MATKGKKQNLNLKEIEFLREENSRLRETCERLRNDPELTNQMLINSEQKYRNFIELAADAFFHGDHEGNFIDVNQSAIELTGYSREELLGMNMKDLFQDSVLHSKPLRYDLLKKGQMARSERIIQRKDNSLLTVEMNSRMMPDGTFQSIFRDITERKRFEDKLKESEFRLARAEKVAKIGNWKIILGTRTMVGSDGASQIYGIDVNTTTLENAQKVPLPEYRPMLDKALADLITKGIPYDLEFKIRRVNDQKIIDIHSMAVYDKENEIVYGVIQDITDQKKTETALIEAKERAEESDRLKSAFLANMSHEIRTPMNGILGFASLLRESSITGEKQQEYLRIIEKSGERMLGIINDIVDISKIESGMMQIEKSVTNVNEQIEYLYKFFLPEANTKNITLLYYNGLSDRDAVISTDKEKLNAVLMNLLKNAIKFTEKGKIEFGYSKKGKNLDFFVRDTGIGIAKDRLNAIFDRFMQVDITDSMARQGAGLGLSISKAYVEMLDGRISVDSTPGRGSLFSFTVPYNFSLSDNLTHDHRKTFVQTKQGIRNLKILIVEDDEISRDLIQIIVAHISNGFLRAGTGKEAVEICRKNRDIDLILMDIRLPQMDGYEAVKIIRTFNQDVVIIAQTAFGLAGDEEKAIQAGCNAYISKPIIKDELLRIIRDHVQLKR